MNNGNIFCTNNMLCMFNNHSTFNYPNNQAVFCDCEWGSDFNFIAFDCDSGFIVPWI